MTLSSIVDSPSERKMMTGNLCQWSGAVKGRGIKMAQHLPFGAPVSFHDRLSMTDRDSKVSAMTCTKTKKYAQHLI